MLLYLSGRTAEICPTWCCRFTDSRNGRSDSAAVKKPTEGQSDRFHACCRINDLDETPGGVAGAGCVAKDFPWLTIKLEQDAESSFKAGSVNLNEEIFTRAPEIFGSATMFEDALSKFGELTSKCKTPQEAVDEILA